MNALEQQHRESVLRAEKAARRRSVAARLAWGGGAALALAYEWNKPPAARVHVLESGVVPLVLGTAMFAAMRLKNYLERTPEPRPAAFSYRAVQGSVETLRPSRLRHVAAVAPLTVISCASLVWYLDLGNGPRERVEWAAAFVALVAVGHGVRRLAALWRARRVARFEREAERWLASADSCQIGPREWTK